ncbi:MAG: SufD family Fe-S cluster assembly protein [Armatimonadota bacterium]|nr:SufD family Fe-S cluster assembly protein [bacterium]
MNTKTDELTREDAERMLTVGVDINHEIERSGTFIQVGQKAQSQQSMQSDVEVMDVASALDKYSWVKDYYWNAIQPDKDDYTRATAEVEPAGYFIRALPGAKVTVPVQTCMYIKQSGQTQKVHNIVIAEEGSELTIVTGCATSKAEQQGMHIGVSEMYIKKNARLNFTMIHNWGLDVDVRPRSAIIVEQGGVLVNNYFCFRPVRMLQMYPTVYLKGENSTATMNSVLVSHPGSTLDVGSRIYLQAPGARAESIARAITTGGVNISRGHLIGEVSGIRAHLECSGLILSENGVIHAIPELEGRADGVEMSHEAAVGKIAEDEVLYLMSRGLTRDEATSAIVRGFLKIEATGLPEKLKRQIDELTARTAAESL